jgi:hypothetical protein
MRVIFFAFCALSWRTTARCFESVIGVLTELRPAPLA